LAICQQIYVGMKMRKLARQLIVGTASVLALGIGGTALDYAADVGDAANVGNTPPAFEASHNLGTGASLWKDDIRWAQVELRNMGLYNGSLDGVVGAKTQRALGQFQENNGLDRTAMLDPQTMQALIGNPGVGQGSSAPPNTDRASSMMNASGAGN
jgi:peptidoglycan hydrolase-like protein with peptidoglycan-binding domain